MPLQTMSYPQHVAAILRLGLPLIGGHVGQIAIGLTDSVMLGRYGVDELAAVTLGSTYFFVLFLLGSGFAWAVMPLVAEAVAREDGMRVRRATRMGLWLSAGAALLSLPVLMAANPVLRLLGQEEQVSSLASEYLRWAGWGIVPALLVMTIKSYLAALERTLIVFWITLLAAIANGLANYALIFGNWGAPELGIRGAALASIITQLVMLAGVVIYALRALPEYTLMQRLWRPDWEMLREVYRLGWPIGLTTLSEAGMFSASAILMGWIGKIPLAAHGVALQLTALTFMVHLGLSNAATIRAGNAMARGDREHLVRGARVVIALSVSMAVLTMAVFLLLPEPLIGLFIGRDEVQRDQIIQIGVILLATAAVFQLMDGGQVIALGMLRGLQDTTVPMWFAGLSYWVVGLPLSYVLGFTLGWGGAGVWLGLAGGLGSAGGLLMWRFWTHAIWKVGPPRRAQA